MGEGKGRRGKGGERGGGKGKKKKDCMGGRELGGEREGSRKWP